MWRRLTAPALVMGLSMIASPQVAGQSQARSSGKASTLTALDYIEIQQLVYSYPYALDTGADHGYMYADLFTADGSFGKTKGREQLAALAAGHKKDREGPLYVRQFVMNLVIEPSPTGATGRAYMVAMELGENGKPGTVEAGGHYEDFFVKTPAGWRFQTRTFIASKAASPPPSSSTDSR
jgi:hypothetical protein